MNNLIKTFATALLICVASITFAQSQDYVRSFSNVKYLIEKLDLADEQAKRIQSFFDAQDDQLKQLRNGDTTDKAILLKAANEIRNNTNKAIKSVLNEEQVEIFNELLSQRNTNRAAKFKGESAVNNGNLIKKLDLNETQITAYKAIMNQQTQQLKTIREGMQNGADPSALRNKMNEVRKATIEKIKKILTEDQLAVYNTILSQKASGK